MKDGNSKECVRRKEEEEEGEEEELAKIIRNTKKKKRGAWRVVVNFSVICSKKDFLCFSSPAQTLCMWFT